MNQQAGTFSAKLRAAIAATLVAGLMPLAAAATPATPPPSPAEVLHELRSFNTLGSVLHVAAHPDDENSQLIAYFSRARGYRTAYLSVNRGDGGQNDLGPQFDEQLGVIRTQELLAARRIDGGTQFFTRAVDFGYSKTPEETLRFWNHDDVLGDVVRVIREFHPDVIVTRFPIPPGSGGHGHHTASAMLAVEAFKLAADPKAYPEQLTQGVQTWQAKRIVWNGSGQGVRGATFTADISGRDPVTGEDLGAMAGRSRGQHKTQLGTNSSFGFSQGTQTFTVLGGDPATDDLMDGVDTTWNRFQNEDCSEIGRLAQKAIAAFDITNLPANLPALLEIRKKFTPELIKHFSFPGGEDPVFADKRRQLDHVIAECLGLTVKTTVPTAEVVPGEAITFRLEASVRSSDVPVKWIQTDAQYPKVGIKGSGEVLKPGSPVSADLGMTIPPDAPLTQPYWLREEGTVGQYHVDDPTLIGRPENPPTFPVNYTFEIGGQNFVITDTAVSTMRDAAGERERRVDIIPPASLAFGSGVSLFTPGSTRPVTVEVTAARSNTAGTLRLDVPADWKAVPDAQKFQLAKNGDKASFTFNLTAPAKPETGRVTASAEINGRRYSNKRIEIDYPHIPFILLQPKSEARLVDEDFAIRGKNVGYVPGDGDDTVMALEQLGYHVTTLTGSEVVPDKLKDLDAVVIGVRAFNSDPRFVANLANLFDYVTNGGTVVAQYNRPGAGTQRLGPYTLSIQGSQQNAPRWRVTDETSPVSFLAPDHPVLNTPNKISQEDFAGWFQERGAYFPNQWDTGHYTSILAMNDPGEAPLQSSLLIAKYGKGYYVYTSLAFFRQLPRGVPGAYRLFANLVSLGK